VISLINSFHTTTTIITNSHNIPIHTTTTGLSRVLLAGRSTECAGGTGAAVAVSGGTGAESGMEAGTLAWNAGIFSR